MPLATLAGGLVLVLALAWLPGQGRALAARLWIATGVLPFLLLYIPWHRLGRRAWWLLPWGLLAATALISAPWLRDPGGGLETFLIQASWTGALALGLVVATDDAARAVLPRWIAAAGAAAALPALVIEGGSFGNPSLLAGFLAAAAVWTGASLLEQPRWRELWWIAMAGGLALQLGALARCQSVAGWAAVVLGLAAWCAVSAARGRVDRLTAGIALGVLLGGGALGGWAFGAGPIATEHLRSRAHMARCCLSAAGEAGLGGVGAGQLHGAFLEAQVGVLDRREMDRDLWTNAYHGHNEVLHALVERGVAGAALLLAVALAALLRTRDAAAWAAVLALAAVGLVSLPLYEPATWVLAALSVGLALGSPGGAPATSAPPRPVRWRILALLAVAVPCGLLASADLLADRLLVRATAEGDPQLAVWAQRLGLRQARAIQHRAALLTDTEPRAAEALALQAVALDPSPQGWLLAGDAAMAVPDPGGAIPHYQEAVRLNPRLFAGHFNLSRAYEEHGDRFSARRHAERARSLRPSDPRLDWLPR